MKNKRRFYINDNNEDENIFLQLNKNKTSRYNSRKKKFFLNKFKKNAIFINIILIFIIILIVYLVIKIKNSNIKINIPQISHNISSFNSSLNSSSNSSLNPSLNSSLNNNQITFDKNYREIAIDEGFEYIQNCNEGKLFNDPKNFSKTEFPKISVIVPVYKCVNTLKPAIRSVQNQKMLDIEIILVNDNSQNETVNIMNELKKEDERIRIINNKQNMRTLYSRAIGVLISKGDYIANLDCDDLFFSDKIFNIAYNSSENKYYDVVSFNSISSRNDNDKNMYKDSFTNKKENNLIISQPELSCYPLLNNNTQVVKDIFVWGKIYKRLVYISALNKLTYNRYSTPMGWNEDFSQLFAIYSVAKSCKFITTYGYYHKASYSSYSSIIANNEKNFADIFFNDIIFDLGKPFCKKYSAIRLIDLKGYRSIGSPEDKVKDLLFKLINKILNSKDIENEYKIKLRQAYLNIFPSLNAIYEEKRNISNISSLL